MRCHICNCKTTWNESFGKETFIVCPSCHKKITDRIKILKKYEDSPENLALDIIITIGLIKEKEE